MNKIFSVLAFFVIWGCTLGATYFVWINFGWLIGILFFMFGAGLAGAFGMFILISIAKIFGIKIEE